MVGVAKTYRLFPFVSLIVVNTIGIITVRWFYQQKEKGVSITSC